MFQRYVRQLNTRSLQAHLIGLMRYYGSSNGSKIERIMAGARHSVRQGVYNEGDEVGVDRRYCIERGV
jgi:hypothetical protein